jgi:hypothetical protein
MQGQSINSGHVPGLRMRRKPTLCSCHASTSCCTATKSCFNAQGSKRNTMEDEFKIIIKFVGVAWAWSMLSELSAYPNSLISLRGQRG